MNSRQAARPRRASIHVRLVALWSNHVIPLKLCAVCVRAALALVCAVSVTFALLYFMSCCFCCLRNECIAMVRILCFDSPCLVKVWTTFETLRLSVHFQCSAQRGWYKSLELKSMISIVWIVFYSSAFNFLHALFEVWAACYKLLRQKRNTQFCCSICSYT